MIEKSEEKLFREYIEKNSGLVLKESYSSNFIDAVSERMRKTKHHIVRDYYNFLRFHPSGKEEFIELLNLLTIKETEFFRNPNQFKVLKEKILPELIRNKINNQNLELRIWSAGCSTGEEPYTLAMVIREILPNFSDWKIYLLATDVSSGALKVAKEAVYSKRSVRHTEESYLDRYFLEKEHKFYLNDKIKKMVNFLRHNLVSDEYPKGFDVIFCRNVTIYFKKETTKRIVEGFWRSLNDGGYLTIGYSESLYGISDKFELINFGDAFVYKKRKSRLESKKFFTFSEIGIKPHKTKDVFLDLDIKEDELKEEDKLKAQIIKAKNYYLNKEYDKALMILIKVFEDNSHSPEVNYLLGSIYADSGNYEKAVFHLKKSIPSDYLNEENYQSYIRLGLIYYRLRDFEEAKKYLKNAIYISPNLPIAHFILGNLYKETGNKKEARREYQNTLSCLKENSLTGENFSEEFSNEILEQACLLHLEKLKV